MSPIRFCTPSLAVTGDDAGLGQRRLAVGLTLVGMASMSAVSLLQTGLVEHLPDPPLPGFDSDKVNLSKEAFPLGIPDGTLALLSLAANLPLALYGPTDRARRMPWLPLLGAAKAVADSLVSAWYFYDMPVRQKAWCGYCIVGAFANFGILALSLPEARRALDALRRG